MPDSSSTPLPPSTSSPASTSAQSTIQPSSPTTLTPQSSPSSPKSTTVHPTKATLYDGITTLPINRTTLTSIHQKPCARDALLYGMTAGFFLGGTRLILRGSAWKSMSWAVGSFCVTSIGSYEFCMQRRKLEKQAIERAQEIMERKKREKTEEMARLRKERVEAGRVKEQEENKRGWWGWGRESSGVKEKEIEMREGERGSGT